MDDGYSGNLVGDNAQLSSSINGIFNNFDKTQRKKTTCIHSRKLMALFDLSEKGVRFHDLESHLYSCDFCRRYYGKIIDLKKVLDGHIPNVRVDDDVLDNLRLEITEVISSLKLGPIAGSHRKILHLSISIIHKFFRNFFRAH